MAEATLNHDPLTQTLYNQIVAGVQEIAAANEVLLAEGEQGAKVREIDKALKEDKHGNKKVSSAAAKAEKLRTEYKAALDEVRNLYRTEVLKEEAAAPTSDVDEEAVKNTRSLVMQSVKLLNDYATQNKKQDVLNWLKSVEIPQVGRKGTTNATGGGRKPRARVFVGDEVFESFGEAAKAVSSKLSTEDNKVEVTSPDLVQAWEDNNDTTDPFDFRGLKIKVVEKEKKAKETSAA